MGFPCVVCVLTVAAGWLECLFVVCSDSITGWLRSRKQRWPQARIPWYLDTTPISGLSRTNTSSTLIWVLIVSVACVLFVGNWRSPLSTQRPLERHMNMKCDVMLTRVMLKVAVYNRYTGCWCHAEGAVCVYSPACGGCSGLLGDLSSVTQPPPAAADTWT